MSDAGAMRIEEDGGPGCSVEVRVETRLDQRRSAMETAAGDTALPRAAGMRMMARITDDATVLAGHTHRARRNDCARGVLACGRPAHGEERKQADDEKATQEGHGAQRVWPGSIRGRLIGSS